MAISSGELKAAGGVILAISGVILPEITYDTPVAGSVTVIVVFSPPRPKATYTADFNCS
jgi:hypothetical protein